MLSALGSEVKIMFLRARDPPQHTFAQLAMLIAPGFSRESGTIKFLKKKINAYYADHRTRLNTEVRRYSEDYIHNNRYILYIIYNNLI